MTFLILDIYEPKHPDYSVDCIEYNMFGLKIEGMMYDLSNASLLANFFILLNTL